MWDDTNLIGKWGEAVSETEAPLDPSNTLSIQCRMQCAQHTTRWCCVYYLLSHIAVIASVLFSANADRVCVLAFLWLFHNWVYILYVFSFSYLKSYNSWESPCCEFTWKCGNISERYRNLTLFHFFLNFEFNRVRSFGFFYSLRGIQMAVGWLYFVFIANRSHLMFAYEKTFNCCS